jgi:hypothetical protein
MFQQVETSASRPVSVEYSQPAGPIDQPVSFKVTPTAHCAPAESGEIVVCGRQAAEQYRLLLLPTPPKSENFLSQPLRVTLIPGMTLGLQPGGGLGLRIKFGPGEKGDGEQPKPASVAPVATP